MKGRDRGDEREKKDVIGKRDEGDVSGEKKMKMIYEVKRRNENEVRIEKD